MNLITLTSMFFIGLTFIKVSLALSKQQRRVLVKIKR